jgi:hypothetical protein
MHEELELFEQITHNNMFTAVPIFLFLNKKGQTHENKERKRAREERKERRGRPRR